MGPFLSTLGTFSTLSSFSNVRFGRPDDFHLRKLSIFGIKKKATPPSDDRTPRLTHGRTDAISYIEMRDCILKPE